MTGTSRDQLNSLLHAGDQAIWTTAAVVLAIRGAATEEQRAAARAVLNASGVDEVASLGAEDHGGLASAQGAAGFAQFGLPMLAGLQEEFTGGARMLDVGTGVAAMAVAYAELF